MSAVNIALNAPISRLMVLGCIPCSILDTRSSVIRHNPVASYLEQLGASDPEAAARLASTIQQDQNTMKTPVTVLSDMLRAIRDTEHAQRINETTERARRKATLLQKRGKQHFSNQNDDEKKQLQSWICLFQA